MTEDTYDLASLDTALAGTPFAGKVRYFPSIHSTNVLAMREAEEGAPEGTVYLADEQTAGRGRGAQVSKETGTLSSPRPSANLVGGPWRGAGTS